MSAKDPTLLFHVDLSDAAVLRTALRDGRIQCRLLGEGIVEVADTTAAVAALMLVAPTARTA